MWYNLGYIIYPQSNAMEDIASTNGDGIRTRLRTSGARARRGSPAPTSRWWPTSMCSKGPSERQKQAPLTGHFRTVRKKNAKKWKKWETWEVDMVYPADIDGDPSDNIGYSWDLWNVTSTWHEILVGWRCMTQLPIRCESFPMENDAH